MNNFISENISLIIPSKNDSYNICKNLDDIETFLSNYFEKHELIIVSNGSAKNEISKINKKILGKKNISHITLKEPGKGRAVREGIIVSKYNNVLFSDADFSVEITEVNKFFKNGSLIADLVIGNRKGEGSQNLNAPYTRIIAGSIFLFIVNLFFKMKIEDSQCGFKAFNKKIFEVSIFSENGFAFDVEMIHLARLKGYKISEVPVKYIHNMNSSVKVLKDSFNMIFSIFRIYFRHRQSKSK